MLPFIAASALTFAALVPGLRSEPADTTRIARFSSMVSRRPHVAGDKVQPRLLGELLTELQAAGFDTTRTAFRAWVPHPRAMLLMRAQPFPAELPVVELRVGTDSLTFQGIWPTFTAYNPVMDREAAVLYVNEGLAADYRTLDSLRVDPSGSFVVARRSACAPWTVAREAKRRGAAALFLYSDPSRDGYMQGEYYPDGRMRHPDAAERLNVRSESGDVAVGGKVPDEAGVLPLPTISLGFKHANQLMSMMQKPAVPNSWQGTLPFRYRAGLGEVRARVVTEREAGDSAFKQLANGFAVLRGAQRPDEIVMLGAHYDAFGPGATENGSGVAVALEVAHRLRAAVRTGWRPARTIVIALWDGGEWGQLGSAQWLRAQPDSVLARVVAYVDLKRVAAGDSLTLEGSPLLADAVTSALRAMPVPRRAGPLGDLAQRAARMRPAAGPSDGALFHEGYGIPSVRIAFDGLDGVRRTGYDTPTYLRRFGDPGFEGHLAVAAAYVELTQRLVNGGGSVLSPARLAAAVRADAGAGISAGAAAMLTRLGAVPPSGRIGLERQLLHASGRPDLSWSRHLLWGTDASCGARAQVLPRMKEAVGAADRAAADRAVAALLPASRAVAPTRRAR